MFPYYKPGDLSPVKRRLRRDNPDHETRNGEVKETAKYLSYPGEPNRLYFPFGTTIEQLRDPDIPAIIVEGEKKGLEMFRWARESRADYLIVALSGVYNWRGKIGNTTVSNGSKAPVKGPLPDFDDVKWASRPLYVLFDSNVRTNEDVQRARKGLAGELHTRKAEVLFAELPKDCGVNGIDDYLGKIEAEAGIEAALQAGRKILAGAKQFKPERQSQADRIHGPSNNVKHSLTYRLAKLVENLNVTRSTRLPIRLSCSALRSNPPTVSSDVSNM